MMLITLEDAKAHLQIDYAIGDPELSPYVLGASAAVLNYLDGAPIGQPVRDEQGAIVRDSNDDVIFERDSNDALIVRYEVQAACKLMLGELWKNREAHQDGVIAEGYGYLPRPVVALLYPLRTPVVR